MTVGIALVTYNRDANAVEIIKAIARTAPDDSVLVISKDGSLPHETVSADPVLLYEREVVTLAGPRRGVVGNRNRAITHLLAVGCEWIVLVDDDVVPLKPGWAEMLIGAAVATDQAFIQRVPSYGEWPNRIKTGEWTRESVHYDFGGFSGDVDVVWNHWATNTVIAVHARAYERVGLYDESFLGYYGHDDVEWQYRLHAAGLVREDGHPHVALEHTIDYFADIDCPSTVLAEPNLTETVASNGRRMARMRLDHDRLYGGK